METKRYYSASLLDRLLDEDPRSPRDRYKPVDAREMRMLVQQDIASLLNHTNIEDLLDENRDKMAIASVINYGVPALIGSYENHHNWNTIEKTIRTAILRFEPRIISESLIVRSLLDKDGFVRYAIIHFEIRGLIYWQPTPIDLCMTGRYDIQSEKVELRLS